MRPGGIRRVLGGAALAAAWLSGAAPAAAQAVATLLAEGFNAAAWPAGWTTNALSAGTGSGHDPTNAVVASSVNTNAAPFEGARFVLFNSWFARSNAQMRLASPVVDASGGGEIAVQFAWFHDGRTGRDLEGATLQWSTNNGAAWHDASPNNPRRGTPTNWVHKRYALPPQARSENLRIGFRFLSQWGNNCYLDDVRILSVPRISEYPHLETFGEGFGAWSSGAGSDYPWTRHSGLTPSGAFPGQTTGPAGAHAGTHYVYVEATEPNFPSKTMILEAAFDFSALLAPRLRFHLHMCGAHVGSLHAEASADGGATWATLLSLAGQRQANEEDPWEEHGVDLSAYAGLGDVRLRFRAATGGGGLGDVALDAIAVEESLWIPHAALVGETGPGDGETVLAGQPFSKTWTFRNDGNAPWSAAAGDRFALGGGDAMGAAGEALLGAGETVAPGAARAFAADFVAPTNRGAHAGFWSLRRAGTNYGERVWAHVRVATPDVAIDPPARARVSDATAAADLSGAAHASATGHLRWTNRLTGAAGWVPAAAAWSLSGLPLGTGTNVFEVEASNQYGVARRDAAAIVRTAPGADTSGNGLPDWWEERYFGAIGAAVAGEDADGDGFANADEYLAGTDPLDAGSFFALETAAHAAAESRLALGWPSATGRVYSLWRAESAAGPYVPHVAGIPADPPFNVYTNATTDGVGAGFFRLRVSWPETP